MGAPAAHEPDFVLTNEQQDMVDTGLVFMVGPDSSEIPEKDRAMVRRGFAGALGTKGVAVTIQRDDGSVVIVTNGPTEPEFVRHEFIHAAQCFAPQDVMASALEAAVENGRSIAEAIEAAVMTSPELEETDHRDLFKLRKTWEIAKANEGAPITSDFVLFEMMQAYYPTKETAALVERLGFVDPGGVYAAMTAYLMHSVDKRVDPLSDLAREIVAYAFQVHPSPSIDRLFETALDNIRQRTIPFAL